jgi:hypothetical protein
MEGVRKRTARDYVQEMPMAGQAFGQDSGLRIVSVFVLGVVAGVFLKPTVKRIGGLARRTWAGEQGRAVVYDQNLPEPLERRELAPEAGQPRFGGTGAIGFPPAAAAGPRRTP